jgi:hypothetical protein
MRRVAAGRVRGEGGATLIEAAFSLLIVLSLVMLMGDFALLELKQSDVTSAARDGARAGIIDWQGADTGSYAGGGTCPTTPASYGSICHAVLSRLAGSNVESIVVQCFPASSNVAEPCSADTMTEGIDSIQVTVSYSYKPVTPQGQTIIGRRTYTASTRMVIQ